MKKNSQELITDFYRGQLKRMHRLMVFLVIILLLTFSVLAWLKVDQNKSNKKLSDTFNTLQTYVQGESQRNSDRDDELRDQHTKLFKAISCLLLLHDSHAITDPAVSLEECQKTANEISSMAQSTSGGSLLRPNSSPSTTDTSSQSNKTPPPTQPQPVTIPTPVGTISLCVPFSSICVRQ